MAPAIPKNTCEDLIRQSLKRTLEGTIEVGKHPTAVKDALEHGQFGARLKAECAWTNRTAQNYMAVAERFGPKSAKFSDLRIDPTAAYLLAAPSAQDQARQAALERAEAGEHITAKVAKQILTKERRKPRRRRVSTNQLKEKLEKALVRYRERRSEKDLAELAKQPREFVEAVEEASTASKKRSG
jgi:hypothetical protein